MHEAIYILVNSSMPDLVKIGRTSRTADERAAELSNATNMPTRFVVAYEERVADGPLAERLVHELLAERGYRVSANREFFNAPLKVALRVLQEVVSRLPPPDADGPLESNDLESANSLTDHALLMQGFAHFKGDDNTLQDDAKAFTYFDRAAALGNAMAHKFMSTGYITGRIGTLSGVKALEHLESATKLGDRSGYKDMWEIYSGQTKARDAINIANSELCFRWFLESSEPDIRVTDLTDYLVFWHSATCGRESEGPPMLSSDLAGQHTAHILDSLANRLNHALRNCATSRQMPPSDDSFSPVGATYVQAIVSQILTDSDDYMRRVFAHLTTPDLMFCFSDANEPKRMVREFSRYLTTAEPTLAPSHVSGLWSQTSAAPRLGFWKRLFSQ